MNVEKVVLLSKDLRDLTPHPLSLSPLWGVGAAIGHRHYYFIYWHSYDGVQRTARPTQFGSWAVRRSKGNSLSRRKVAG